VGIPQVDQPVVEATLAAAAALLGMELVFISVPDDTAFTVAPGPDSRPA